MFADDILNIPLDRPERLFGSRMDLRTVYRELVRKWHPDVNADPKASAVFQKVNELYHSAKEKAADGIWQAEALLSTIAANGTEHQLKFREARTFELGSAFIGDRTLGLLIDKDYVDLADKAKRALSSLKYESPEMRAEFERYFPTNTLGDVLLLNGKRLLVYLKTPDVYRADMIREAVGGKLDPKHVAWVTSRMLNICVYLQYCGIAHYGISEETVYLSPELHSALLLGGWFFAFKQGDPAKDAVIPNTTAEVMPLSMMSNPTTRANVLQVKALARKLLGHISDSSLLRDDTVPEPMRQWLVMTPKSDALDDYTSWKERVLPASFGAPRFIKLDISDSAIYK